MKTLPSETPRIMLTFLRAPLFLALTFSTTFGVPASAAEQPQTIAVKSAAGTATNANHMAVGGNDHGNDMPPSSAEPLTAADLMQFQGHTNVPPLWKDFVQSKAANKPAILPDYSYAGYHACEKPLPKVTSETYKYFNVVDFGAVPNSKQSSRDAVLKAIDAAQNNTGPAVVYFPPGRYLLNEKSDLGKPGLVISKSNIVLKGAGMAETELFFTEPCHFQKALLLFRDPTWSTMTERAAGSYSLFGFDLAKVKTFPPRGSYALEVENAAKIKPGMVIGINGIMNFRSEGAKRYFAPHDVLPGPIAARGGINPYSYEMHRVKNVTQNQVTFEEPIQYDFQNYSQATLFETRNIEEVGLEDLTLCGNNQELFYHHMGSRIQAGYSLLSFYDVINGWVRNVRFRNYGEALKISRGGYNTCMNLVFEGNVAHMLSGAYYGSYGNLFVFNRELAADHHGPIGNGGANTVALRSAFFGNMEMHGGWSRCSLMDACEGNFALLRGGGAQFYPHQGEFNCYWNWLNDTPGKVDFWPTGKPYGYMMPPFIVGFHGAPCEIINSKTNTLADESQGALVWPESLFEAQLALRLGAEPDWLLKETRQYEEVSRHSSIQIQTPISHSVLDATKPVMLTLELDPKLKEQAIKKIQIKASSSALDSGFKVVQEIERAPYTAKISLEPGTWVLTAVLINSRGEASESRPVVVYLDNGQPLKQAKVVKADTYDPLAIRDKVMAVGLHVDGLLDHFVRASNPGLKDRELDAKYEEASLAAYKAGIPIMTMAQAGSSNPEIAASVIDETKKTPIKINGDKRDFLFDLGTETELCRMDLCFDKPLVNTGYKVELMGSNDPKAWFTFLNDEGFWESALVRNGESRLSFPVSTHDDNRLSFYFPTRKYRYFHLVAPGLIPASLTKVRFYGPN